MENIRWDITVRDAHSGETYEMEDVEVYFSHELNELGDIEITVGGVYDPLEDEFHSKETGDFRMFKKIADYLEQDEHFIEAAIEEVEGDYVFSGFGSHNPDRIIERRYY